MKWLRTCRGVWNVNFIATPGRQKVFVREMRVALRAPTRDGQMHGSTEDSFAAFRCCDSSCSLRQLASSSVRNDMLPAQKAPGLGNGRFRPTSNCSGGISPSYRDDVGRYLAFGRISD